MSMWKTIMIVVAAGVVSAVGAEVKGPAPSQPSSPKAVKSEMTVTTTPTTSITNVVYPSLKNPSVAYSGVLVHAVKTRNPLQALNPVAPAGYGPPPDPNLPKPPLAVRSWGITLFAVQF
jgi:hypothetical protein